MAVMVVKVLVMVVKVLVQQPHQAQPVDMDMMGKHFTPRKQLN